VDLTAGVGVVEYEPAEMVVRAGAGTTCAALDAVLAEHGQMVPLDPRQPERATIGSVLASGRSGIRRLRYGPVRDVLLEATLVLADGTTVKAGGPVVKNVTGYDLCRLFVGSRGTLGFLVECVLRCQPRPAVARWLRSEPGADPFAVRRRLFRPSSILWDGATTWVLLEGRAAEVEAEQRALGDGWVEVDGPRELPGGGRESLRPSELRGLEGEFVAEVGVGTVHRPYPVAPRPVDPSTLALHERLKASFDPEGRMNPAGSVF
jgi:glycolate oxidase FAD binding subunit